MIASPSREVSDSAGQNTSPANLSGNTSSPVSRVYLGFLPCNKIIIVYSLIVHLQLFTHMRLPRSPALLMRVLVVPETLHLLYRVVSLTHGTLNRCIVPFSTGIPVYEVGGCQSVWNSVVEPVVYGLCPLQNFSLAGMWKCFHKPRLLLVPPFLFVCIVSLFPIEHNMHRPLVSMMTLLEKYRNLSV